MSALPPKADMCGATSDFRQGHIADIRVRHAKINAMKRGKMTVISVNSPSSLIEPPCCLTMMSRD